jgi:hypothetical protein
MPESPYRTLKRLGTPIAELPITLLPDGAVDRQIYVAKVRGGVRIGVLHKQGETSLVIPSVLLDKVLEIMKSWT